MILLLDPSKGQHEPFVILCAEEIESILCRLGTLSCRANKVRGTVVLHTSVIRESVHAAEGFDSWLSPFLIIMSVSVQPLTSHNNNLPLQPQNFTRRRRQRARRKANSSP